MNEGPLRAAAQQALDALLYHVEQTRPIQKTTDAIVDLRAALARPAASGQPADEVGRVSVEDARVALDSMDDYARMRTSVDAVGPRTTLGRFIDQVSAALQPAPALPPVGGDILPAIGERVLIHLGRQDKWVEHEVVGYYVWPHHGLLPGVFRVFVRVRDFDGLLNARALADVRALDGQPLADRHPGV